MFALFGLCLRDSGTIQVPHSLPTYSFTTGGSFRVDITDATDPNPIVIAFHITCPLILRTNIFFASQVNSKYLNISWL
jgi:hypothetical protein